MTTRCELIDYEDRDKAYDNPRVIIEDGVFDKNMVRITIGEKTVKVAADELMKAIDVCTRLPY